jgi:hypothetical protein
MGNPKLLWLFISIPIIAMITGVIGIYWANMNTAYGSPVGNESLEQFNKLDDISSDLRDIKNRTTTMKEDAGLTDRLGNYFSNAYSILVTIPTSFDLITGFISLSIDKIPMGESGTLISTALITIFIALVIIGILLAILLKSNL